LFYRTFASPIAPARAACRLFMLSPLSFIKYALRFYVESHVARHGCNIVVTQLFCRRCREFTARDTKLLDVVARPRIAVAAEAVHVCQFCP